MDGWMDKRIENLPILQYFVPFWSRCLKKGQFWDQGSHRSRSGRRKKRRGGGGGGWRGRREWAKLMGTTQKHGHSNQFMVRVADLSHKNILWKMGLFGPYLWLLWGCKRGPPWSPICQISFPERNNVGKHKKYCLECFFRVDMVDIIIS